MGENRQPNNDTQPIVPQKKRHWGTIGILISTFAILVLIFVAYFTYIQFSKFNNNLIGVVNHQQQQYTQLQADFHALTQRVDNLNTQLERQAQLQDTQQKNWQIQHAHHLAKLANDYLMIFHDLPTALSLLQTAQSELQNTADTNLDAIKQALNTDVNNLQNATAQQPDTRTIYNQLNDITQKLNDLPTPNVAPQMNNAVVTTDENAVELPWWKKGLQQSWSALKQIVVIRHVDSNELLLPQQKAAIVQQAQLRVAIAEAALLTHQPELFQSALQDVINSINQNFVQDAPDTQAILKMLEQLKNTFSAPSKLSINGTLQAFDQYSQSRQQ